MRKHILFLLVVLLLPRKSCPRKYTYKNWADLRNANWTGLLFEPSAFVAKSHARLRNRPEGYKPGQRCAKYVGLSYLDHILESRQTICKATPSTSQRRLAGARRGRRGRDLEGEAEVPPSQSSVDCYTAPYVPVGSANKATVSLCHSRNMVLNTCAFLSGRRKGTLAKKFPLPAPGSVQLACDMDDVSKRAAANSELQWLNSIHHSVWWANATRSDDAVRTACAPNSTTLVTTPTLFVMRDRHANYAHEMEVVSMAFSFLAALEPSDVAQEGMQVVIVDQAPPTGFLETWARISHPHKLRILAHNPYPPGTCFRSAYHVYTFAAGIGYNTNAETVRCESPVVTGLSHWLRGLYEERDPWIPSEQSEQAAPAPVAVAGPYAAASGVQGLRPPTAGIIMKNVVWLSRRNLELVRLLLNASVGWKAMRMVRNEDEVVAAILAAVQEWNAESCLLKQFERAVQAEYEKSFDAVHAVHLGPGDDAEAAAARARSQLRETQEAGVKGKPTAHSASQDETQRREVAAQAGPVAGTGAGLQERRAAASNVRRRLHDAQGGSDIDEHGNDGTDEEEDDGSQGKPSSAGSAGAAASTGSGAAKMSAGAAPGATASTSTAGQAGPATPSRTGSPRKATNMVYNAESNTILLNRLWEQDPSYSNCRKSNVLFTFVDGDFNDMPYHQQLKIMFRTGVLVGVHGAGLTHGFFMPPGQSAVLQLLGTAFAKVAANNVFRNMAAGIGNFYQDVLYSGVDVNVDVLKAAVKQAMDFVANSVMEAQRKQNGGLISLMLDDQSHFSIVVPSPGQCPRNATR